MEALHVRSHAMNATQRTAYDLGVFERSQGIGGPSHDRLLFTMREHHVS
jgi:hypothetical protein